MKTSGFGPILFVATMLAVTGCDQQPETSATSDVRFSDIASGETFKDVGDYVIHFNAFTTDHLAADVAREYGIARSTGRAMLNVTVMRKAENDALGTPVMATVVARTRNLAGQLKNLSLRELVEGNREAIYYVGDVAVTSGETLIFEVEVTPEGEPDTHGIKFQRRFVY